jgi:Ca2+-dependent lipid-binding protein
MDPYVIVKYGEQEKRTTVHMSGHMNPSWPDDELIFSKDPFSYLELQVWNFTETGPHDYLGGAVTEISGYDLSVNIKIDLVSEQRSGSITLNYKFVLPL